MRTLFFDAFSGASGDMILGALVDVGADFEALRSALAPIARGRFELRRRRVVSRSLAATKVDVSILGADAEERNFGEIAEVISSGRLAAAVRDRALEIFRRLCEAEGEAHGIPSDKVHLHEAGAIDAIADICGAAWLLDALAPARIVCSPLNVGSGTIDCRHGTYPVPGPATARLLSGIPIYAEGAPGERVTPTGAAVLATVVDEFGALPPMRAASTGYGAGEREFPDRPNVLRAILGETVTGDTIAGGPDRIFAPPGTASSAPIDGGSRGATEDVAPRVDGRAPSREIASAGEVVVIETTIDDMNPQNYGWLLERAAAEGALDVFLTPVVMKKGRPGTQVTVIADEARFGELARLLFRETTTIGFRWRREARRELARSSVSVVTPWGEVRLKVSSDGGEIFQIQPEYEDCKRIASSTGVPLKEVQRVALAAWSAADGDDVESNKRGADRRRRGGRSRGAALRDARAGEAAAAGGSGRRKGRGKLGGRRRR